MDTLENILKQNLEANREQLREWQDIAELSFYQVVNPHNKEDYDTAVKEWKEACQNIKDLELLIKLAE